MAIRKINTRSIEDGAIAAADVATGSITTAKIASSVTLTTPTIDTITSAAATALTLKSAGTTAVTIDTSQNVGIGTALPTNKLTVSSGAVGTSAAFSSSGAYNEISFKSGSSTTAYIGVNNSDFVAEIGGAERMRIDASGNILNGVTSIGSANPGMYIQNNQATSTGYNAINTNTGGQAVFFAGAAFSGGTYCSFGWNGSAVASGSYVYTNPNVTFLAGGGNNNLQIGTSGTGAIKFYNGATQSVTFDSSGRVLMPQQPKFQVWGPGTNPVSGIMVFTTVQTNIGSCYSTSNGRFTAPVAGTYVFYYQFLMNAGSTDIRLNINGTGTNPITETDVAGSYQNNSGMQVVTLAANDYVQVNVYGGTAYGNAYNNFSGYLIG